jgi:hypothetical protein
LPGELKFVAISVRRCPAVTEDVNALLTLVVPLPACIADWAGAI